MTARRKNLAAGREGRLLINAGAEARRGARSRALALRGGWLSTAGSWPADKGSAAEHQGGQGDTAAGLGSGLAQPRSTRLGGHCGTRWDAEQARSSAPLQYPNSILYPCTQTSAKGRAHNFEQVANFYPAVGLQLCRKGGKTSVLKSPRRAFSEHHLPPSATVSTKALLVGSSD